MKSSVIVYILLFSSCLFAQKEMQKLDFMVGEWIGNSTSIKADTIYKKVPAYEKISYKIDENIITIDLASETLKLHTVIYYSKEDDTYYYNPFYKSGAATYPATYEGGKLIISPNDNKRFIFTTDALGNFTEYGEELIDGVWKKYFEDKFVRN